mmetsp:Transcript_45159/g.112301  ORF Transcript_45159/g.112301 Transcript_45159/m.112301 type:complete len:218 (+) Transcript_45159:357-1010(+)
MCSRWPSRPTTVKSSLGRATRRSSCGTPSASASTPSRRMATPSGSRACASRPPRRTRSSCLAAGTSSSRCGIWQTASFAPTWWATLATSTQSPSPLMAPFARRAARTAPRCCGTSTRASTCIPSRPVTSFTRWSSHRTATGCALPPTRASRFGISSPSLSSMSFPRNSRASARRRWSTTASRSAGPLMVPPSSLGTLTGRFASGRLALAAAANLLLA